MSEPPLTYQGPAVVALDPIAGRELLARLRSGWTYLLFAVPPLIQSIALFVVLVFGHHGHLAGRDPGALGFQLVFWIEWITVGLLLPAFAAGSFARERAGGTLPLLAATGLSAGGIYRGKFLSQLLQGLACVSCSLPLWLFLLVEMRPAGYWPHAALLGSFLLLEITLCLFWSALAPGQLVALLLCYSTTLCWALALIFLLARWQLGPRPLAALTAAAALIFGVLGYRAIREHGLSD